MAGSGIIILVVFLISTAALFDIGLCSDSEVTIQPIYANELLTGQVTITCWAGNSATLITMRKEGESDFATVNSDEVNYGSNMKANMEASGRIEIDNSTDSFLSLTISNPTVQDAGKYECDVIYKNWQQKEETDKVSAILNVDNRNVNDLVQFLMESIFPLQDLTQQLQRETNEQQIVLDNQEEKIRTLETQLSMEKDTREKIFSDQKIFVSNLETLIDRQATQLEKIDKKTSTSIAKETTPSAFLATVDDKDHFYYYKKTTVYPDVKLNVGGHYSKETGFYTAPIHGLYVFHALGTSYSARRTLNLQIRVNGVAASELFAYDKFYHSQNSMSVVCELQPGDAVGVYVDYVTGKKTMKMQCFPQTTFSGYLVYAL